MNASTAPRRFGRKDLTNDSRRSLGLSIHPVHGAADLIRLRMKKMAKDLMKVMEAVFAGSEFASIGQRDATLFRLLCSIFSLCPELEVEDVVPLFKGSIDLMAMANPTDHLTLAHVEEKARRAKQRYACARIFVRADHAEIGEALIADIGRDLVTPPICDFGSIYAYSDKLGIWRLVERSALSLMIQDYADTCRVGGSPERPPHRLKVSKDVVDGAISLGQDRIARPGFFADARPGVAFENGYVAIKGGGVALEPHSHANRALVALPFHYVPGVSHEKWDEFLASIFRGDVDAKEKILALQEFVGACLFGAATRYARALVLLGEGRNGKSVFIKVIQALFPPDSQCSIPPQSWDHETRRAQLNAKLLNSVSELPKSEIMRSESFKAIVAGDRTDGRHLYKDPFTIHPKAGHIFAANTLPPVDDQSRAFWERLLVIKFNRVFEEWEQIKDLDKHLIHEELAGIACWAVEGVQRLFSRFGGTYTIPASHKEALDYWRLNSDQVAQWMAEQTLPATEPDKWRSSTSLYDDYKYWAAENGHRPLAANKFGERLQRLGVASKKPKSQTLYALMLQRQGLFRR